MDEIEFRRLYDKHTLKELEIIMKRSHVTILKVAKSLNIPSKKKPPLINPNNGDN